MTDTKVCRTCGEDKPLSEFYFIQTSKSGKDLLALDCKPCAISKNALKKKSLRAAAPDERDMRTRGGYAPRPAKHPPADMRICRTCKVGKPVNLFQVQYIQQSGIPYYMLDCIECRSAKRRDAYANDPIMQIKHRNEVKAYNAKDPEGTRQKNDKYRRDNPEVMRANMAKRRTREKDAGGSCSAADIADIRLMQHDKCAICRKKLFGRGSLDHRVALKNHGTNDRRNCQLLCRSCNSRKSAIDEITYMQSLGRLI